MCWRLLSVLLWKFGRQDCFCFFSWVLSVCWSRNLTNSLRTLQSFTPAKEIQVFVHSACANIGNVTILHQGLIWGSWTELRGSVLQSCSVKMRPETSGSISPGDVSVFSQPESEPPLFTLLTETGSRAAQIKGERRSWTWWETVLAFLWYLLDVVYCTYTSSFLSIKFCSL